MSTPASVDWIPGLVVLAWGLVVGIVLVWRTVRVSRATPPVAAHPSVEVRDLAGKRDALLLQLRELEDTADKRTPAQLARDRYALELAAARVLVALDEQGPPAATLPAPGAAANRAGLRVFLWGAGTAATLALLGFLVHVSAQPRAGGGSVTGNATVRDGITVGDTSANGLPADPEETEIQAALALNRDDVDAHLALARVYLRRQDVMGLWNETKLVLELAPGHPQALAYQALVRLAMGQAELALRMLKNAVATDPNLLDCYVHMALVYARMGRGKDAEGVIAEASTRFPDQADGLKQLLLELQKPRSVVGDAGLAAAEVDSNARLGVPAGGGRQAGTPVAEDRGKAPANAKAGPRRSLSGTVDIDSSLQGTVSPEAVLFVFIRDSGFGAGPPLAAKRLPATFPAAFEISTADAMMGQVFPDSLLVEARLDSDGDPATRPPTDLKARLDDVKSGRTDVRLVLTRP